MTAWHETPEAQAAARRGDFAALLRMARLAADLDQAAAARLLNCSRTVVSRYETGALRLRDIETIRLLSKRFGIPAYMLGLSDPEGEPMRRRVVLTGLAATAFARDLDLVLFSVRDTTEPATLDAVKALLRRGIANFASVRLDQLAAELPQLLSVAKVTALHAADKQSAYGMLADAYVLAGELAIKLHDNRLAGILADRAVQAAYTSGCPRALARAQWRASIALRRSKQRESAQTLIDESAEDLRLATGLETAWDAGFYTRMLCCSAYTSALAGRQSDAFAILEHATEITREYPNAQFTVDDVNLYGISVSRAIGENDLALGYSRKVHSLQSTERRVRFHEDTAITWWQAGNPAETFRQLLATERIAPDEVKLRPWAQRLTVNLLSTSVPGVRDFASRNGLLAIA